MKIIEVTIISIVITALLVILTNIQSDIIDIKCMLERKKKGHWIDNHIKKELCNCSKCGGLSKTYFPFCPYCGTKMEDELK